MKRLVILGGGESGIGTALLGKAKGYQVFVSDKGKIKENYKQVLIISLLILLSFVKYLIFNLMVV